MDVRMESDRRKDPRISLQQCVQISLYGLETFIDAEAINISENGILCLSSVPIENLEKIFVMVDVPIGNEVRTLQCTGIVMYTQAKDGRHLFGIHFIDLEQSTRATLQKYAELNG